MYLYFVAHLYHQMFIWWYILFLVLIVSFTVESTYSEKLKCRRFCNELLGG